MRSSAALLLVVLAASGCGEQPPGVACGISSLAGAVMILDQFSTPGQALSSLPRDMPEQLPVRVAAGPVVRGLAGRTDSLLVIGIDEPLPATPIPGFGVMVVSPAGVVQGVVLFEGIPIAGAPHLGTIHTADRQVPLIGLQVNLARIEDPRCPLFPPAAPR
jgi:hypothetical protein